MRLSLGRPAFMLLVAASWTRLFAGDSEIERLPSRTRLVSFDPTPPADYSDAIHNSAAEQPDAVASSTKVERHSANEPLPPVTVAKRETSRPQPMLAKENIVAAQPISEAMAKTLSTKHAQTPVEPPRKITTPRTEPIQVASPIHPVERVADASGGSKPNSEPRPLPESVPPPEGKGATRNSAPNADNANRLTRNMADVQTDIRPKTGEMPEPAAGKIPAPPDLFRYSECGPREEIFLGWTPWTVCYRPLYFEDRVLEREGESFGAFQPAVSCVKFITHATLLPAEMIYHRPRSYQCGDGIPDGTVNCCP